MIVHVKRNHKKFINAGKFLVKFHIWRTKMHHRWVVHFKWNEIRSGDSLCCGQISTLYLFQNRCRQDAQRLEPIGLCPAVAYEAVTGGTDMNIGDIRIMDGAKAVLPVAQKGQFQQVL